MQDADVVCGREYVFVYPDYGEPCGYPEYAAHSGQVVKVERVGTGEPACVTVVADDGWRGVVCPDELVPLKPTAHLLRKVGELFDVLYDEGIISSWSVASVGNTGVRVVVKRSHGACVTVNYAREWFLDEDKWGAFTRWAVDTIAENFRLYDERRKDGEKSR